MSYLAFVVFAVMAIGYSLLLGWVIKTKNGVIQKLEEEIKLLGFEISTINTIKATRFRADIINKFGKRIKTIDEANLAAYFKSKECPKDIEVLGSFSQSGIRRELILFSNEFPEIDETIIPEVGV